jgi:putative flippase GtrA
MIGANARATLRRQVPQQLAGFALVGAARTALGYLFYLALLLFVPYWLAFTVAYGATLVFSMLVNGNYVFGTRITPGRVVRYGLVYSMNYGLSLVALIFAIRILHLTAAIAPVVVVGAMFPVNFLAERFALTS